MAERMKSRRVSPFARERSIASMSSRVRGKTILFVRVFCRGIVVSSFTGLRKPSSRAAPWAREDGWRPVRQRSIEVYRPHSRKALRTARRSPPLRRMPMRSLPACRWRKQESNHSNFTSSHKSMDRRHDPESERSARSAAQPSLRWRDAFSASGRGGRCSPSPSRPRGTSTRNLRGWNQPSPDREVRLGFSRRCRLDEVPRAQASASP